ncbi:MAG TPA: lamin tail domain-containing protein [Nitrososphaera sp.]|nr:lamin tail domain-containing protein [Nitrososphaera sp.]
MSIKPETVLALLLLPIVGGIPSAVGQNALSNITTVSDIIDFVGNVTESEGGEQQQPPQPPSSSGEGGEEGGEQQQPPQPPSSSGEEGEQQPPQPPSSSEEGGEGGEEGEQQPPQPPSSSGGETEPPLSLEEIEDLSSSTVASDADDTSSVTAGESILVNEVELNPSGNDNEEGEWIELYNPTDVDINIRNFGISPSFQSPTIELPPDAVIEAGETYVIALDRPMLSNTGESLVLANATGDIHDRTPSLVDRSDDDRTWQRTPDGNSEWQFVENTQGNANDDPDTPTTILDSEENTQGNANDDPDTLSTILDSVYSGSDVECLGSADCIEGVATRIVDGDTLYVRANSTVYKVDLALVEAPSRTEEMFVESTAFTRDLCLGSTVLVDQDDMLLTSNSGGVIGVVYCSSSNLNSELLNNGYSELDTEQCATSEFANEPWVKDHGC